MSRRRRAEKREIFPDPKFGDLVISKFMNNLMIDLKAPLRDVLFISSIYGNVAPNPSLYENFELESHFNYVVNKD